MNCPTRCLMIAAALLVLTVCAAPAKRAPKLSKVDLENKKVVGQLQGLFKSWDRDKSDVVDEAEFDKFYAKWKLRAQKNADSTDAAKDPQAPLTALFTALDKDKDREVNREEFDNWATEFAPFAMETFRLQTDYQRLLDKLAVDEQKLGILQVNAQHNLNVDPVRAINRGSSLFQSYQKTLASSNERLQQIEAKRTSAPHGEYYEFVLEQLPFMKKKNTAH